MKISFQSANTEAAQKAKRALSEQYGQHALDEADIVVVLGGDGALIHTLHEIIPFGTPVYGMHMGSIGFLLNDFNSDDLPARLAAAQAVTMHPLIAQITDYQGTKFERHGINDIYLNRATHQAAKIDIYVDGVKRLERMICDGVIVATPAGSTGYNLSAHGPVIPLGSELLCLTPISVFRPRRWRGALLPSHSEIAFDVAEGAKRPVHMIADFMEVRNVQYVEIKEDKSKTLTLLFDPELNLDERIRKEQFMP